MSLPPRPVPVGSDSFDNENEEHWVTWQRPIIEREMRPHEGLRRLRIMSNTSQTKMAEIMRVSRRSYQAYEAGKSPIPSNAILGLASWFSVDLNELFTGKPLVPDQNTVRDIVNTTVELTKRLLAKYGPRKDRKNPMCYDEVTGIVQDYCTHNELGRQVDQGELVRSIRVVTGDKFEIGAGVLSLDLGDDLPIEE